MTSVLYIVTIAGRYQTWKSRIKIAMLNQGSPLESVIKRSLSQWTLAAMFAVTDRLSHTLISYCF